MGLFLGSCGDPVDHFAEYRGVDLIPEAGFDAASVWAVTNGSPYMSFAAVTAETPPDDEPDAAVYRLEVLNLAPDGGFDDTDIGKIPDNWTEETAMTISVIAGTDTKAIDGKTLRLYFAGGSSSGSYTLPSVFKEGGSFSFFFTYRNDQASIVRIGYPPADSSTFWELTTEEADPVEYPNTETLTDFTYSTDEGNTLWFAGFSEGYYYFDNLRLVRNDIDTELRASFTVDSTAEPLIDGAYAFSVWAKAEGAAGAALGDNRFACRGITLSMYLVDSEEEMIQNSDSVKGFFAAGTDFTADGWTRLVISHAAGESFLFSPDGTWEAESPTLILSITPADTVGVKRDIGSVLIAAPRLEFLPDNE
jgi:hypothetical protein